MGKGLPVQRQGGDGDRQGLVFQVGLHLPGIKAGIGLVSGCLHGRQRIRVSISISVGAFRRGIRTMACRIKDAHDCFVCGRQRFKRPRKQLQGKQECQQQKAESAHEQGNRDRRDSVKTALKKSGGQGPHYTQKLPAKLPTENVANPVDNLFMTTRKPHGFKLSHD
ncbi:hypothetical protein [Herbaspirillum lusitanum]|uniref:hypothetical protein n=1 Tax=Herbaspirillum lusitanum TaxID=213312 RepID=UPI0012F49A95|nr:hypothetical protein [Herbaspirillum lusitanum]